MNNNLPVNTHLDISPFSRILSNTSTSYKFLFFLSLIRKIKEIGISDLAESEIKLFDLVVEMLLVAWFPHRYFKLSFGVQDQCAKILGYFVSSQNRLFENGPITNTSLGQLRMELSEWLLVNKNYADHLLQYVPYRLLSPFYSNELKGLPESNKNKKIILLTETSESIPFYKFTTDSILIDARWREYIQKNMPIIEGWVNWQWCEYLQNRNPSIPAVPKKILPILSRISMTKEIDYWKDILKHKELKCIYSKEELNDFALDHFLPWTFVTHNQLWNLIPVTTTANSSKSNNLPSLSYLDDFIEEQFVAIQTAKEIYPEKKWKKIMQPYIADLHISDYDGLTNQTVMETAFRNTIMPLYEIADTNGFSAGWTYQERQNNNMVEKVRFVSDIEDENKYNSYLPFYPIEVAAGNFADSELVEEPSSWVDISETNYHGVKTQDLFITKITGHSMEPTIPDGSYCLFKYGVAGSRANRIVLAKKDGLVDPDLGMAFTVKRYFSEKIQDPDTDWLHTKIELRPDNPDYDVISIESDEVDDFSIIAEFIEVLS